MARHLVILLLSALSIQGSLGISVNVSPPRKIVKAGDPVEMVCHINGPVDFCRIEVPNEGSFVMNPNKNSSWMSYFGAGLERGDCGIRIFSAKESYNGDFLCALTATDSSREVRGYMNLTIAKTPSRPELRVTPPQNGDSYREGEVLSASCAVGNGRPAANITWYIGDERISEGLGIPVQFDLKSTDLYNTEQNLTRTVQASDNGKPLRCVAVHPLLNDKQNTSLKIIYVKFGPKDTNQPLERFGLVEGEEGRIAVTVNANPQPSFVWVVNGQKLHEGDADETGRFRTLPGAATPNQPQGSWDSVLLINPLMKEDVERSYELIARNNIGEQTYRVVISTSPEPKMLELGAGAIVGIVVAVLVLLTVAALLLFARAKGRWCFAGASARFAGESSDTESADHHHSNPKVKKTPFTSVFKKKSDKVAMEEASQPKETKEDDKDEVEMTEGEESRVKLNPDEGVVYAELDLNLAPAARPPAVRQAEDKTEYAEIIHNKEST